jgi:hypothetical protein
MDIKVDIWSKKKESSPNYIIEEHIEISEHEICELILDKWIKDHETNLNDERTYFAEIDQVIH